MGGLKGCVGMISIEQVEISDNPVNTNQSFLLKVILIEIMATWNDTKVVTWSSLSSISWDKVKRKIF